MMKLSNVLDGRDNNFNLLRIVAALAVIISHSFVLALGAGAGEPLHASLGITLGSVGVDVFFVTSGFLVTRSLLMRQDALEFFWSRLLRIYPALIMMTVLTVFILGPVMTQLPLGEYFSKPLAYFYLLKNASLLHGVAYTLPGVFTETAYPNAVNGALWSLPYEIAMYLILFFLWCVLRPAGQLRLAMMRWVLLCIAGAALVNYLPREFASGSGSYFHGLLFMFFAGASAYILRERIILSRKLFSLCILILLLAILASSSFFFLAYNLILPYLVLFIVFIPGGVLRRYNRLGDYSYGLYIYAFPVQQCLASLVPQITVWQMILISSSVTLILSMVSWHFLESHAVTWKAFCVRVSKHLFNQIFLLLFRRSAN